MPQLTLILAVIIYTVIHSVQAIAQEVISLSENEAITFGLKNNNDIIIATDNVALGEYKIRESKGNFLPKLNLVGSYVRNIDKPVIFLPESFGMGGATKIGSNNNFNTYLDLSVPLYSKYNIAARNYAQDYFYLQRENLRASQQILVANIKKAYLECLLKREVIRVREAALTNAEYNQTNITHKVAEGVSTEYDETSVRVRVSNFTSDLLEAKDQALPAGNRLKLLLGLPAEAKLELTDSLYFTPQELTGLPDSTSLVNNSTLKQKELAMQIAKRQTQLEQASFLPTLSGTGTYQYQSQQNDFRFSSYNWVLTSTLGLRLQLPVFNGLITRNRIQQAAIRENIARHDRDYTWRSNDVQYRQLASRLTYLKKRMDVQSENIRLAARAIELIKERYHYGKANLLEVNTAELDYVSARLSYLQSVADYKSTYCDLELLTGQ